MKRSHAIGAILLAFVLGVIANLAYVAHQIEQNRAGLEEEAQRTFVRGESFDSVSAWPKAGSNWTYNTQTHAFETQFPALRDKWLQLIVEVDDQKRIQKVKVVSMFRL